MSAGTEPARWQRPRAGSEGATHAWLDALVSGKCTPEEFSGAMRDQFQGNRDGNWEVLSLLDQYYRRGKIKLEMFRALKSRIEDSALGRDLNPAAGKSTAAPASTATAAFPSAFPSVSAAAPTAAFPSEFPSVSAAAPTAAFPSEFPPVSAAAPTTAFPSASAFASASTTTRPPHAVGTAIATPASALQKTALSNSGSAARDVAMGDVLRDRYKILGVLGHGGMGTVYEALDEYRLDLPTSGQRLAIKVLHTAVTERDELLSELQREFQNLQLLSHPNIVRVHEFDRDGDLAFLTMELLRGSLLSRVLSARNAVALPRPYALAVIRDVGAALSHAHSRGVVHGDVNPQNIFITSDGELRVLDFGASHKTHRDVRNLDYELSRRSPVATPGYASCQVLEGQQPDASDDLFAFACATYLLLSGQHPFPKRTAVDARAQRVRPRRPPGLTGQQWRVLQDGLRWERHRRPSDIQKWLERFNLAGAAPHLPPLSVLVDAEPPRKGRPLVKAVLILGLLLLAAGGYGVATNYDSLLQTVMGWSALANLAPSNTGALPPAPVAAPQTPAPDVDGTAPIAAAKPIAPATPTPMPAARTVAPKPPAHIETSTRAVKAWPAHIELATDTVEVEPGETSAWITVHRKGDPRGVASFTWWTESGTAKPVLDFSPVTPRAENIGSGKYTVSLNVAVSAKRRSRPKSFYVVIDQTESGAPLGARTLTMVTLLPSE